MIEKNTLPSLATTSESVPVLGSGVPCGDATPSSAASTWSLVTAIASLRAVASVATIRADAEPVNVES